MSGGLTPCRQLRPSSRRELVSGSNSHGLLGFNASATARVISRQCHDDENSYPVEKQSCGGKRKKKQLIEVGLSGGFTPCRHLRPSSGREHTIVTYSVR